MGKGYRHIPNESYIVDENKTISENPIIYHNTRRQEIFNQTLIKFCLAKGIDVNKKVKDLKEAERYFIFFGRSNFRLDLTYKVVGKNGKLKTVNRKEEYYGVLREIEEMIEDGKVIKEGFLKKEVCNECFGTLFNEKIGNVEIFGEKVSSIISFEIQELYDFFKKNEKLYIKDKNILGSINSLLDFLELAIENKVAYLNLNRTIPSLSGGEFQKIHFCSILNSKITGIMYVIDEISANLHVSEYESIFKQLKKIKDKGNTVLLVEHQNYFIKNSDVRIKIGPGSGIEGGLIIDEDDLEQDFKALKRTSTEFFEVNGITNNNLENLSIKIPLYSLVCICGISGSGKSSLANYLNNNFNNFIYINQKAINSPNTSIIASFLGIYEKIREIFAKENNVDKSYFSFNIENGQCENCRGKGYLEEYSTFKRETFSYTCPICEGKRFNEEVLNFKYKNYNIYEILNLTIKEILNFNIFEDNAISKKLKLLEKIGLDYLTLFRSLKHISGGESQRLKVIKYINSNIKDKFFIFDEPFRGIDEHNFKNMMSIFDSLIEKKATILIIEHKLNAIKNSDYIIELDGSGKSGGDLIFQGRTEEIKDSKHSLIKNYI